MSCSVFLLIHLTNAPNVHMFLLQIGSDWRQSFVNALYGVDELLESILVAFFHC